MYLDQQYELVQSSRKVLLEYCETLQPKDFLTENSSFGSCSIRSLLVHIAHIYEFWIGNNALYKNMDFTPYASVQTVADAARLFVVVDELVKEFFLRFSGKVLEDMEVKFQDKIILASPLKLFTHVITHEFHHKGQVLSLSRHLGYVPVDTDIIR